MAAKDDDKKTASKATVTKTDTKETKKVGESTANEKNEVTADEPARPVSAAPAADDDAAEKADEQEGDDHIDAFADASGDLVMSKEVD